MSPPTDDEVLATMRKHHARMLWTHFANITLGFWLLVSPAQWVYGSAGLVWSDLVSGALLVAFGTLSLSLRYDQWRWGVCAVGLWLLLAPLVFWAPTAASYANDTLVGTLAVAFSVLVPGMPGKAHHRLMMTPGPEVPPGWSYNPASWWQRGPIIAVAFVGFLFSRYLAAYQLGHIPAVWDPVFGDGTKRVLESDVSRSFPVSDAGLGAVAYLLEFLTGYMGATNRWRTMPWMVALFGFLIIPLGVVSIVLITLQPLAVGAWCTLCLASAACTLLMIAPSLDEVIASLQFLIRARREGKPLWRTFWTGGTLDVVPPDTAPARQRSPAEEIVSALGLESVPWNLALSAALGVWLMAAPAVLGSTGAAANNNYLLGALVMSAAVIAIGEVARPVRFVNILFGAWLVGAPWILHGFTPASRWNDMLLGAALIALSIRRGPVHERYGGWERYIV